MKKEIKHKLCRIRLEKLSPDTNDATHKLVFKRRKAGKQLYKPMAGGEARRAHKEGKWCYWITVTCPTDRIRPGDLVLDVQNNISSYVQIGVTEEFLNIMNNDDFMEKVIATRNDKHGKPNVSDEDVECFIKGKLSDRVQVKYEIKTWEEECPTCKGTGKFPKYPQFQCKCKTGKVTTKVSAPVVDNKGFLDIEENQTLFTRKEVIQKLHDSLDANVTGHKRFRKLFVKQLNNWIDKNL